MARFKFGGGLGYKAGSPLKRKTGLKSKAKLKSKPVKKFDPELFDKDKLFYEEIWREREHACEVCGVDLPDQLSTMYMDHLLPKRNYPEFRHVKVNVRVVCIDCHTKRENGFPGPKHQYYIDEAKRELLD